MTIRHQLIILELIGNLNLIRGEATLEAMKNAIKPGTGTILTDFSQVGFVDSAGLATLVRLSKLTQAMGIRLALCALSTQMKQLLQLTGMEPFFDIFESREACYADWISQFPSESSIAELEAVPVTTIMTD